MCLADEVSASTSSASQSCPPRMMQPLLFKPPPLPLPHRPYLRPPGWHGGWKLIRGEESRPSALPVDPRPRTAFGHQRISLALAPCGRRRCRRMPGRAERESGIAAPKADTSEKKVPPGHLQPCCKTLLPAQSRGGRAEPSPPPAARSVPPHGPQAHGGS